MALTAWEHELLVAVGDEFALELAASAHKALAHFRPEVHDEVLAYLQDRTSLHSPLVGGRTHEGQPSPPAGDLPGPAKAALEALFPRDRGRDPGRER